MKQNIFSELSKDSTLSSPKKHKLGYYQACDIMISKLTIQTQDFKLIHDLFNFLQCNNLKYTKVVKIYI